MAKWTSVQVGKIDLDTCGAAYLLGVSREDKIEVLRGGQASEEDLANPNVLCIEVGGSGRVAEGNFDHHGLGSKGLGSATLQAWQFYCQERGLWSNDHPLSSLVDYIDRLDRQGPQALGPRQAGLFPTLSDVFAGMLLVTRDPAEQLHAGVKILREVNARGLTARTRGVYERMPVEEVEGWFAFAEVKAENNRQVAKAVENAQWGATFSGLKLAWLETDFFGAPGALYGVGAQVVVAYSRHFGPAGVPKFTIAGNGIKVDAVLAELNAREPGWGGPATGTIIGSPREGSNLTLNEVVEVVTRLL